MKTLLAVGVGSMLALGSAFAAQEPGLPSWNEGELAGLEAGGWVAGSLLLTDEPLPEESAQTNEKPLDLAQPTAEEIADEQIPPTQIPEKFWPEYFSERPKSFLVDPQGLLGPVDYRDRLGFLNYHAGDSMIDLFVYVFGGDQEIPGEVREEELVERLFSQGRPAAVVYYYLGAPQRSVIYLSPSLTDTVSAPEQRRALESSVMQAFNHVDPAGQIEGFLVQMSIRIYWMERMLGGAESEGEAMPVFAQAARKSVKKSSLMEWLRPHFEKARRFTIPAAVIAMALLVAFATNSWLKRRARYRFPEIEVEPRLGGAHAAGVGAVISFASAALPPASQRDQVPDYLRRA
ncbi:MAG: hypothetical protein Q8Q59_03200 [Luteolibacter sp.]|jgi:hypothetical protein|nr:hypothetical protein [Luteolibacter sp.]